MKITDCLSNNTKTSVSFEILPPIKGASIDNLFNLMDDLAKFDPKFISVTYHQAKKENITLRDGRTIQVRSRKRPGSIGVSSAIKYRYGINAVPHMICRTFSPEECEDMLVDLEYLGIHNVLALLGDAPSDNYIPAQNEHKYASDLVEQIMQMNKGIYLEQFKENTENSDFCVGVAAYPEKHQDSYNLEEDIFYLKQKVKKGAEYAITQFFFDNEHYYKYIAKCKQQGLNIPIIPGLKPLFSLKQAKNIARIFNVKLPKKLVENFSVAKTAGEEMEVGLRWCQNQCEDLIDKKIPNIHLYSMSKAQLIIKVMQRLNF